MTILGYGTHAGHKYRHITKATLNRRVIKKEALCGGIRTERANQATDKIWDLVTDSTLEEALAYLTTRPSYHTPCQRCVAIALATQQKEAHL